MPLVAPVSYRTWPVRFGMGLLYLFLTLGGITMVYPFALMVSTSFTSEVDSEELRLIPRFLHDDDALHVKYLASKYGTFAGKFNTVVSPSVYNRLYDSEQMAFKFQELEPPDASAWTADQNARLYEDWLAFREQAARRHPGWMLTFFMGRPSALPSWSIAGEAVESYRDFVDRKFRGDLAAINEAYDENLPLDGSILYLLPMTESPWSSAWLPPVGTAAYEDWTEWQLTANPRYSDIFPLLPSWRRYLETHPDIQGSFPADRVAEINRLWGTAYASLVDIPLPDRMPAHPVLRQHWMRFVQNSLSRVFVRFEDSLRPLLAQTLREEYGDPANLKRLTGADLADFDAVAVPASVLDAPPYLRSLLYQLMIRDDAPGRDHALQHLQLLIPEAAYAGFLADRYGSVEAVNQAYGWRLASLEEVRFPRERLDWIELRRDEAAYKRWMIGRNYGMVTTFIAGHGRALYNTAILCFASILFTLTINPLCAYALSRYGLSYSNSILIYLLATMAFPPSVAMIPSFLLLRDFHLLNTYWALLLPGAANGFTVFMMKGFFDTLPKEIFEAAKIDGASELRIFFRMLVPLCKPVFGYFALGAFTSAYSGFIWAFTICPKEEMWTMMVWLYQLTTMQPAGVQMAALVMAAIPTLLVFTVVQNIILKGIVLPSFH